MIDSKIFENNYSIAYLHNKEIGTTVYGVCGLTGLQGEQCDQIMRWFSKPQSVTVQTLDSVAYSYV